MRRIDQWPHAHFDISAAGRLCAGESRVRSITNIIHFARRLWGRLALIVALLACSPIAHGRADPVCSWDNAMSKLKRMGSNGTPNIWDSVEFDDGSGPALFVGGTFDTTIDSDLRGIGKWTGDHWDSLDGGVSKDGKKGIVYSLAVFDDGSGDGPALFVGGSFKMAGDVLANNIAKWDGKKWSPLGSGSSSSKRYARQRCIRRSLDAHRGRELHNRRRASNQGCRVLEREELVGSGNKRAGHLST